MKLHAQLETFPASHATLRLGSRGRARAANSPLSIERLAFILLAGSLLLTVLEGAIRKWVIGVDTSSLGYAVYFSKDLVFLSLYLLPAKKKTHATLKVFRRWLLLGCFLFISGALGSSAIDLNPVGGVLTLRAAVLLPLLACAVLRRINAVPVRPVAWLLMFLTLGNFVLGVVQNHLPPDNVLNRYASSSTDITVLATGVRATGTFAYIAGMAVLAGVGIWAGIVLLSLSSSQWDKVAGWVAVASGFGCGLASVSRSPILLGTLMLVCWGVSYRMGLSSAVRIILTAALICWIVVMLGLMPTFSELGQELMERQETAGDSFNDRAFGQFQEAYQAFITTPFGNGFGTEQVAGNYYRTGNMSFTTYETQLPRIIMEAGILGLIGYLLICASALHSLQAAKRASSAVADRSVFLATQMLLVSTFYTNVIFNHTASSFTWVIFAVVMSAHTCPESSLTLKEKLRRTRMLFAAEGVSRLPAQR